MVHCVCSDRRELMISQATMSSSMPSASVPAEGERGGAPADGVRDNAVAPSALNGTADVTSLRMTAPEAAPAALAAEFAEIVLRPPLAGLETCTSRWMSWRTSGMTNT